MDDDQGVDSTESSGDESEGAVATQGADAEQEGGGGAWIGKNCYRNSFSGMYQTESGLVGRFNPDLHFIHEGVCHYEGQIACIDGAIEPGDEGYCSQQSSSGEGDGGEAYASSDSSTEAGGTEDDYS